MDVIITYHHSPPPTLPNALTIIDPKREDANYPFPFLAAVGVAYKLVQTHAMESWDSNSDFRELIRSDEAVTAHLCIQDLDSLFSYDYYLRYVDHIFNRLGLS